MLLGYQRPIRKKSLAKEDFQENPNINVADTEMCRPGMLIIKGISNVPQEKFLGALEPEKENFLF